jgi:Fibronectin type III domain
MPARLFKRSIATLGLAVTLVLAAAAPVSAARFDRTPPSQPADLHAVTVTHTSISVAWSPSTDNVGVRSYTMWVDGLGLGVVSVEHPLTSATWSVGLRPGQTYTVLVRAWDAAYNGSTAATLTVTTPADTTAPTVPTGLSITAVTASQALLTWTSSTDAVGPVDYDILVDGVPTPNAWSTRPAGSPRTAVSGAWVRRLTPGTSHVFAVRARDGSGNTSAASTPVSATTQPSTDTVAPTAPTLTQANNGGTSYCPEELWLQWTPSSDNSGTVEYEIRVNGTIIDVASGSTSWITYTETLGANAVTVTAVDGAGNASAPSNTITVTTNWGFGSGSC